MGVPALFRWLSKKYPKIVIPVVEEEASKVTDEDGNEVEVPIDINTTNPNGKEFDNLYLDFNGIVHPCTHPEGKPAPATEQEMMLEIFSYTERVVNMIRPRRLLFIAIDGVAPRAKMNQQRSRRFRAAQEAEEKEQARQEGIALFESLGKKVEESKEAWDSNAITPGTPFMDLLSTSIKYWVTKKLNTDPGWKKLEVIFSDASVPGEGEHKIMDWIRRQRSHPEYDPNTSHVIYGLDADLIMLSLATHEPNFRVLREDVFFQESTRGTCRICGQEGHYAAQCTGTPADKPPELQKPVAKKPFIFLDVPVLREYLEIELNLPNLPFPFNFELAIDDWVLLIFFVGNDFLPHLPSLEIREGAIDTLLKIWKEELPRMGGYLTNNGRLELSRIEVMIQGLAQREDEIFKRRREAEERKEQSAKRRKLDAETLAQGGVGAHVNGENFVSVQHSNGAPSSHHPDPSFSHRGKHFEQGVRALGGSNHDVVANRHAIRLANMSAADILRAELSGGKAPEPELFTPGAFAAAVKAPAPIVVALNDSNMDFDIPGLGVARSPTTPSHPATDSQALLSTPGVKADGDVDPTPGIIPSGTDNASRESVGDVDSSPPKGTKRKLEADDEDGPANEDEDVANKSLARVVRADGTVDQPDTIRLWEPGYKERYYQQKFGVGIDDNETRKKVTQAYIEGLAWVLHYYYQGTPSWKWYYPYHFAPFAGDFQEVSNMKLHFDLGMPFKAFEQLMGVFPARSRAHIPVPFHPLMTEPESPIIDFYPTEFEIDMNGKKMAWQGVALLPFIDEKRLLDAMAQHYPKLTKGEVDRNKWGPNVLFCSEDHDLYHLISLLYTKRPTREPLPLDTKLSGSISGTALADPSCIPHASYPAPFNIGGHSDIYNNRVISVLYYYPKQLVPHRSIILPGAKRPPRVLGPADAEHVRRGGRGGGPRDGGRSAPMSSYSPIGGYSPYPVDRGGGRYGGGGNDWQRGGPPGRGSGYGRGNYSNPGYGPPGYQYNGPSGGGHTNPYAGYGGGGYGGYGMYSGGQHSSPTTHRGRGRGR